MKKLNKIDLTQEGEPRYTTFFYHKNSEYVWEVISNGTECAISLMDRLNISRQMKWNDYLPKYIISKL